MSSDADFEMGLKKGKVGESLVWEWMILNGYEIEDVTNNGDYKSIDVDFVFKPQYQYNNYPDTINLEVKKDAKISKTGNLYLETLNNSYSEYGWAMKTKADLVFFVAKYNFGYYGYLCNWRKLKEYAIGERTMFWDKKKLVSLQALRKHNDILIWDGKLESLYYSTEFQAKINGQMAVIKR